MVKLDVGNGQARSSRASRPAAGPRQTGKLLLERLEDRVNPGFLAPVAYGAGNLPYAVAVADFNGDGIPDLAVANANGGNVSVLLGNGDGSFQAARSFYTGDSPESVAVADFNGDGVPDLAVGKNSSTNVSVLLGNGDGTFQAAVDYAAGDVPKSVAVGDFNGDGIPDLAAADATSYPGTVSVLLGNGDGTFQAPRTFYAGRSPQSVAVGDFNGDGILDLAVANSGPTDTMSVLLGNGDGTFEAPLPFYAGRSPQSVVVGDFNGDGIADLAWADWIDNSVWVALGNGDGTFRVSVLAAGRDPWSVAVGDFNGDGLLDLAVANEASNNVSVLLGNGDGSFQAAVNYAAGNTPRSVAVGDFNSDDFPDLAVADSDAYAVSILLNDGLWGGGGAPRVPRPWGEPSRPVTQALPDSRRDPILRLDTSAATLPPPSTAELIGDGSPLVPRADAGQGLPGTAVTSTSVPPQPGPTPVRSRLIAPAQMLLDWPFADAGSGWLGDPSGGEPWWFGPWVLERTDATRPGVRW
jgi:hypothetical protein